jgi:hypothetical protein
MSAGSQRSNAASPAHSWRKIEISLAALLA